MEADFRGRVLFVAKVAGASLILAAALFYVPDVLLLIFAGILVSILLTSLSGVLTKYAHLPAKLSLAIVVILILGLVGTAGYFAAPSVAEQSDALVQMIPESVEEIRTRIEGYSWGQNILDEVEPAQMLPASRRMMGGVGGAFSSLLGWFANLVIIMFIGLYGAVEPGTYTRGFLHLIPEPNRERTAEVLSEIGETLQWWLIGKFFGMAVIGVSTALGLWLLDVPLALVLGIIAALFTFIPNIGPILAAVPAVLLGFTVSPQHALYVGLLYTGIQVVETYLLTPLVERKTIELPPALTLAAQVLLGVAVGGLGVALATPLMAVALVATKRLYVEDELGDPMDAK